MTRTRILAYGAAHDVTLSWTPWCSAWHVDDWPPQVWNVAASIALGASIALTALTVSLFLIWDIRLTVRIVTGVEKRRQIDDYAAQHAQGRIARLPALASGESGNVASVKRDAAVNERLHALSAVVAANEYDDSTQQVDAAAYADATTSRHIQSSGFGNAAYARSRRTENHENTETTREVENERGKRQHHE